MGFKSAPKEIQVAFVALKQRLNKPLSLHKISGNYYVYEYFSVRDQKRGKLLSRHRIWVICQKTVSSFPRMMYRQSRRL